LFEDRAFSIPVDYIECRVVGGFQLSDTVEEMRTATWETGDGLVLSDHELITVDVRLS
jgi:hypothetical protein